MLEIGTEVELLDPDDLLEKVVERVDQRIEHRIEAYMVETFSGSDHALSPSQIKAIDECSDGLKSAIIDTYRDSVASAIYVQKGSLDLKKKDQKDSVRLLYGGLILAGVVEIGLIALAFIAVLAGNAVAALAALFPVVASVATGVFVMLRRGGEAAKTGSDAAKIES